MAITITKVRFSGDYRYQDNSVAVGLFDVAWDSSYPTGGETADLSTYFAAVQSVINVPGSAAARGIFMIRPIAHDQGTAAAGKLLMAVEDGTSGVQAEVADMTDVSAVNAQRIEVRGTLASNYSG